MVAVSKSAFLLGTNISRSLSPAFQNAAFEKTGYNAAYTLVDVSESEFDSSIASIVKDSNVIGFNITAPFKERILPYLISIDKVAQEIGAVNTVKIQKSNWIGFNTDVDGISASLKRLGFPISNKGKKALVLGAGGAARACIYTLLEHGFDSVSMMNRTDFHAKAVARELGERFQNSQIDTVPFDARHFADAVAEVDLVVNAISDSGADHFPIKVDFSKSKRNLKLFDLGYKGTSLIMKKARASGVQTLGGLLMLVEQGARSFEIWTGVKAPRKTMIVAAEKALESGNLVQVETHSAISVVNALATGKGSTIGVEIPCRVEASFVESKEPRVEIKSSIPDPHKLIETSVNYALSEIKASIPRGCSIKIAIDSSIPPAVGLKSSSAVSVAVVKAIFKLFNVRRDPKSILDVSCRASKDSKASITGAYDDASAALLGGLLCTDNTNFEIVKHTTLPRALGSLVEILVPMQKRYTSSIDKSAYSLQRGESQRAFQYALKAEIAQAMFLNSVVQCAALGYSLEPVIIALMAGASASGITGKGPAVAAICSNSTVQKKVRKKWSEHYPDCTIISTRVLQPAK